MQKPDARTIIKDARRLLDERFNKRDSDLAMRERYRFREVEPDIPVAYKDTAKAYKSPVLQDEGRQVAALVFAMPVPKVPPPTPELQPQTTKMEQFLIAFHQELEDSYGSNWWKNTIAQVHQDISWIYWAPKRDAYSGGPTDPGAEASLDDILSFSDKNDAYKRGLGAADWWDYRHVPTRTVRYRGDIRNPLAVYEVKEVDERDLMLQHGLTKDYDGTLKKIDHEGTTPSGYPENESKEASARKLKVIEYWDRNWCMIILENGNDRWRGSVSSAQALVLDEWEHGWGRVPYFAAPAFENEVLDEDKKFETPLAALYVEVPNLNDLRTAQSNVAKLKGYPTWQDVSKENSDPVLDDEGKPKTSTKFQPGVIYHTMPGHEIKPVPMETGTDLLQEILSQEQRIVQFSLSPVSKGISPGADTANSALSTLRRLQRSALDQMNKNQSNQARAMYKFALQIIKEHLFENPETVYVYSEASGDMIPLSPEDIVTYNVQAKVAPDTGQDMLIEEKQAAEMFSMGLISELEYHERRGKENPEEYVAANVIQRAWMTMEQEVIAMAKAELGNLNVIGQMIAASQETGDAATAIPSILDQIQAAKNPSSIGTGSPDMPRGDSVRNPAIDVNTQPNGALPYA